MVMNMSAFSFKYVLRTPRANHIPEHFSENTAQNVLRFHRQLPDYQPTRLVRLQHLARAWGIGDILVKDESTRFGLLAFKALGGSYAVARLFCQKLGVDIDDMDYGYLVSDDAKQRIGQITLTTATDGNHGRGVAWTAERFGQDAVIFMPKGSARSRIENIRFHGAGVEVTDLNYDDTVRLCQQTAGEKGWTVIQDTVGKGDTEIPLWIMQGYMTMFAEAVTQMKKENIRPTHVFLQAGVGSFAAAAIGYFVNVYQENPPGSLSWSRTLPHACLRLPRPVMASLTASPETWKPSWPGWLAGSQTPWPGTYSKTFHVVTFDAATSWRPIGCVFWPIRWRETMSWSPENPERSVSAFWI